MNTIEKSAHTSGSLFSHLTIMDEGRVASSQPGTDRQSNCFSHICVPADGSWIVTFRTGPRKTGSDQRAVLTRSVDFGKTWSEPTAPFSPPHLDGKPGTYHSAACTPLADGRLIAVLRWVDNSDPSLPWLHPQTEGLLDTRSLVSISGDGGETWSPAIQIDAGKYQDVPTPYTGPVLIMPDGRWAGQFETNKPYEDNGRWEFAPGMVFSEDEGKKWSDLVVVQQDPTHQVFYWDQRPTVMPDGSVATLFWVYDTAAGVYLNIHGSRSDDGGRTWSQAWDTGVSGQAGRPVQLRDGRLLMVYIDREAAPMVKARLSSDGGHTWPDESELIIHQPLAEKQNRTKHNAGDAWLEMEKFSVGLPDAVILPDGNVLVTYYAGPTPDDTSIHWARLSLV